MEIPLNFVPCRIQIPSCKVAKNKKAAHFRDVLNGELRVVCNRKV